MTHNKEEWKKIEGARGEACSGKGRKMLPATD